MKFSIFAPICPLRVMGLKKELLYIIFSVAIESKTETKIF
jgi:hypothetical protein